MVGFESVTATAYLSTFQVFDDLMNGPVRLFFPFVVALISGSELISLLTHRGIANVRTRKDVRRVLLRTFRSGVFRCFLVFTGLALVCAVAAFAIVPAVWPQAIDPVSYGLRTAAAVHAMDVDIAPLTATGTAGWGIFAIVAAAWAGVNAAAFGLVTLVSVVIIHRPVVALLIPAAVYLGESLALQFMGLPGPSFLISALYPAGLSHYSLGVAVAPTAVLIVVCVAAAAVIIARAPTSRRMS